MIKANVLNVKYNNVEVKINLTDGDAIQLNIQTEIFMHQKWITIQHFQQMRLIGRYTTLQV